MLFLISSTLNLFRNNNSTAQFCRHMKRWVSPTLREHGHRAKKQRQQNPNPRSCFNEWNYRAELYAFGKRVNENFKLPLLQRVFTDRAFVYKEQERQRKLGIAETLSEINDNTELSAKGILIAKTYVKSYVQHVLPKVPVSIHTKFVDYLLGIETLANVAIHLGAEDLIRASEYPPTSEELTTSLLATIGALAVSSDVERAFMFVRDFICTQLNQVDLLQVWMPDDPLQILTETCKQRNLGHLEQRLLNDCAKNTILSVHYVGIYANRQLLGKGFGEDLPTAKQSAAIDALQTLFDLHDYRQPLNFQLQVDQKILESIGI